MVNVEYININAQVFEISEQGTNNYDIRNCIKDLVINHNRLIGTCRDGTLIILNQNDLESPICYVKRNNRTEAIHRDGFYQP